MSTINTPINAEKLTIIKNKRTINLRYDNKPLTFETSDMFIPFGINRYTNSWSANDNISFCCSCDDNTEEFKKTIDELDAIVEKKLNDFTGENFELTRSFSNKNPAYKKYIKLNITRDREGDFSTYFYDSDKNNVVLDDSTIEEFITKRGRCKCIIECAKIWTRDNRASIIWNANIVKSIAENEHTEKSESEGNTCDADVYNSCMID